MKRKMFLSMLVLVAMLFTACAPKATPTPVPATSTPKPAAPTATPKPGVECMGNLCPEAGAELTVSGWGGESEQNVVSDSIARFNEHYPDIKVNFEPIPADYQTKLKAAMAGGAAPDVFYVDADLMTAFGRTGQLLPLDDYMAQAGVKRSDYIGALLSMFTYEGTTFGLPKDFGSLGLVYLPEFFEQAGIPEPTADWTYDDLKAAAKTITENTGTYGMCVPPDVGRWPALVYAWGGEMTNADFTEALFNSPEAVASLEYWYGLYEDDIGAWPSDIGAGWCGEAIGKELTAMALEGGWMVNYMNTDFADVEYKIVEIPKGPAGGGDLLFTNSFGAKADTKYPNAAALLVFYLTGEENLEALLKTGFALPTQKSLLDHAWFAEHPNETAIAQGGAKYGRVFYYGPETGEVLDRMGKALERVFLGEQSPKAALDQAVSEVNIEVYKTVAAPVLEPEAGAELTVSGWGGESEQNIVSDSIARFNEHYPDIKVNFEPIPADYQTKLKAAMAGGAAPDVFYVDADLMTAFGRTGQLLPLDDYMAQAGVKRSDYIGALLSMFTYEGTTFGLPKDFGSLGLVYLPEFFEQAGIPEPTADWTYDDLKAAAKTITENTGTYGMCVPPDVGRWPALVYAWGGEMTNADFTEALFNSPEAVASLEYWYGLYEDDIGAWPSDIGAGWCGEAIGKELTAMALEGGWMVNYMNTDFADVEYKIVEVPKGPAGGGDLLFTNSFGAKADTKYPNAAALLVFYLTGEENLEALLKTGFALPTQKSLLDHAWFAEHPNETAIAQGGAKYGRVFYYGPETGEVLDRMGKALERVFLGEQSPQEALDQAVNEINTEVYK
ncbi:MAG: ABC transporter substrate-binding protein [Chloroflexi bacterium]|nr:ABC transporter substrate-binding protein [Chloroflexota bacterium]